MAELKMAMFIQCMHTTVNARSNNCIGVLE
jgi:hypothetical protein